MKTLALALLLQAAPAPAPVEEPVSKFQNTNIVIGACERYVPLDTLVAIDKAVAASSQEMREKVAYWREVGRQMAITERFDWRICSALLRNALG